MDWAEELENRILDINDKELFKESINCLNSKCYRAGYIISWISIIENFKRKLFELSNSGNKEAQQSWKRIESIENQKKSIDIQILEELKRINFIDTDEATKLDFLYNQRCIFAHPYEKAPTEDELKYIIALSVNIALSKGIIYKKNFIDTLINDFYEKPYYLPYSSDAIKNYAKTILPRIEKRLLHYFFKSLYAKIGELIEKKEINDFKIQRYLIFIYEIFKFSDIPLDNDKWRLEELTLKYPFTAIVAFANYETWPLIPERIKEILIDYSIQNIYSEELEYSRRAISTLIKKNLVDEIYLSKFAKLLENRPFYEICNLSFVDEMLYDRLHSELTSGDFYKQRDCIIFIRTQNGKELLNKLRYKQLRSLGKEITYAAHYGCWEAQSFIRNIIFKEWPLDFCLGLFLGCLIDRRYCISIKDEYFSYILLQINELASTYINKCFKITQSIINKANNDNFFGGVENLENIFKKLNSDYQLKDEVKDAFMNLIALLENRIIELPF